jgi:hypothetical protein
MAPQREAAAKAAVWEEHAVSSKLGGMANEVGVIDPLASGRPEASRGDRTA